MHYTAIEQRIIDLLADGLAHDRHEVFQCLKNPALNLHNLAVHIQNLRPKVRALGQEIVTEHTRGGISYRHVILLSGSDPKGSDPV